MAEADENLTPEEPAAETAPEPEPEVTPEPATGELEQPASPPDLGDAIAQMNARLEEFGQRLPEPEPEQEPDLLSRLMGNEPEPEEQPYESAPEQQPQAEDFEAQLNAVIEQRVQAALEPHLVQQQAADDTRQILAFAEKHPRIKDPQVMDAVANALDAKAARYGNDAIRSDPAEVEAEYFAYEARQAASGQPSNGAEAPEETPAEAGGSQGTTLETGAGPGAPQQPVDPVEKAYMDALTGGDSGPPTDIIG